jgi:delta 1-pyrroline-5-carboxylate dehydrogenase
MHPILHFWLRLPTQSIFYLQYSQYLRPLTVQVEILLDMSVEKQEFESWLFINNQFVYAKSRKTITVTNPANDSLVGVAEAARPEDVDAAVAAASAAFKGEWSTFTSL